MDVYDLVGKKHKFDDGDSIEVFQIKSRGPDQLLVTFFTQQGPGIPRKLVMEYREFMSTYGHLFADKP